MVQMKAMWTPGMESIFLHKDPQKIADEIFSISDEPTKEQIVDLARDEGTELHDLFEWNDSIAAENWRGCQARKILQNLKVRFVEDDSEQEETKELKPVRMFFESPSNGKGFMSTVKIMNNEELYQQLLTRAKAELASFANKYSMLKELQPIFKMIEQI